MLHSHCISAHLPGSLSFCSFVHQLVQSESHWVYPVGLLPGSSHMDMSSISPSLTQSLINFARPPHPCSISSLRTQSRVSCLVRSLWACVCSACSSSHRDFDRTRTPWRSLHSFQIDLSAVQPGGILNRQLSVLDTVSLKDKFPL